MTKQQRVQEIAEHIINSSESLYESVDNYVQDKLFQKDNKHTRVLAIWMAMFILLAISIFLYFNLNK